MKHLIAILILSASFFTVTSAGTVEQGSPYLPVVEGAEWAFQEFFELPQTDKVFSKNVVVSKVCKTQSDEHGVTAYISNFLGSNSPMWMHMRDGSVFLNGNGYVQAFRFDGRGEYTGSFSGGVTGKSTISIERGVTFTTQHGTVFDGCIKFIEHAEAGQKEIVFAPNAGPVCVREVKSNGAARGFELFEAATQIAKAN